MQGFKKIKSAYKYVALIINCVSFQSSTKQIQGKRRMVSIINTTDHYSLLQGSHNILDMLVIFPLKMFIYTEFSYLLSKNKE